MPCTALQVDNQAVQSVGRQRRGPTVTKCKRQTLTSGGGTVRYWSSYSRRNLRPAMSKASL